jgi:signal transduction histidine kinase/CheY-like chemotaxis protein
MRPALPLSAQLLLTFVGLLVGITAVLTTAADTSLRDSLETDARANVAVATRTREQALTQLFRLRQQRAQGFLVSIPPLCSERLPNKRFAWIRECVSTLVDDFRRSERASGAVLRAGARLLRRSGSRVSPEDPAAGALARPVRLEGGEVAYTMRASAGELTLRLQFTHDEVEKLFADSTLGHGGRLSLVDDEGQVFAPAANAPHQLPVASTAVLRERCNTGMDSGIEPDVHGVPGVLSFRPVADLGTACITARIGYAEALAPAQKLRRDLVTRGAWFVLVGIVLSLVAANWIAAPVRRLAAAARNLQVGRFDRPIPLAGPSEVRALGRAFNGMANDLAELVAKEQAARRQAEAANRSKDDFLATVSHELRTPLTAILGWAHMLQSDRLPPDRAKHAIGVIARAARTQRQLIDDLLDVSRIVSNRLQITRVPLSMADIVEAALDTIRPHAAAHHVTIETTLDPGVTVNGDARRLEQVVWNLAWNAVKFTQPGGKISVRLARVDQEAVLAVTDTGVGISSAFLPHVFEWFKQGDKGTRSQSGLGLGLGIARHLVRLHGGSVRAESRGEGYGATFIVTLPVYAGAETKARADTAADSAPLLPHDRLTNVRVLVVEDDDDTRELVRVALESVGATVESVASASDARREVLAEAPDVLISDIRMPEEDGYSLIRSLRLAGVATPAIALTAFARREDAEEARAAGFHLHLPKPVDSVRLVEAVVGLLGNQTVH